jgi:hypothetical protein
LSDWRLLKKGLFSVEIVKERKTESFGLASLDWELLMAAHVVIWVQKVKLRVLLGKTHNAQLLKNFPTFYGTRGFFAVFTRAS